MLLLYKLNPILSCSYPSFPKPNKSPSLIRQARVPLHPKILDPHRCSFAACCLGHIKRSSIKSSRLDTQIEVKEEEVKVSDGGGGDGGDGNNWSDWVTSGLLFGLWAGLMYYVFQLAPNQTPVQFSQFYYLHGLDY
jgi:hypothetical protein